MKGNSGSRYKQSCIITKTEYNSFIVEYYDDFNKNKVELFPSIINKIIYK